MWPLRGCYQKHKGWESRIISWRGKTALPLLFYFSCEYQLLGRQQLLVILPVYAIEGTGCCESLGKKLQHKCLLFGQLSALLSTFRLLTPALIFCPETVLMGSQEPAGAGCCSHSQFCGEEGALVGTRGQKKSISNPQGPLWEGLSVQHKLGDFGFGKGRLPQQGKEKMDMYLCIFF